MMLVLSHIDSIDAQCDAQNSSSRFHAAMDHLDPSHHRKTSPILFVLAFHHPMCGGGPLLHLVIFVAMASSCIHKVRSKPLAKIRLACRRVYLAAKESAAGWLDAASDGRMGLLVLLLLLHYFAPAYVALIQWPRSYIPCHPRIDTTSVLNVRRWTSPPAAGPLCTGNA